MVPIEFAFAGILIAVSIILSAVLVWLPAVITRLLRLSRPSANKQQTYECGITPTGGARVRFSIKFYLVAMLFILFDVDAVLLYPWSTVQRWLGWFGLQEMGVFVLILLVGYLYIWKRGAFQWDS
jgi:NADH-quinone oxidoreductase subunit A